MPERPLFISKVEKKDDCTLIAYRYLDMDNQFTLPFIDDASIENSLNCLAACLYLMLPPQKIKERMARLEPVAMRLEVKEGKNGCLLINDSYNSDLGSLDIALDFQYRRSQAKGLKRTLILSDIARGPADEQPRRGAHHRRRAEHLVVCFLLRH